MKSGQMSGPPSPVLSCPRRRASISAIIVILAKASVGIRTWIPGQARNDEFFVLSIPLAADALVGPVSAAYCNVSRQFT